MSKEKIVLGPTSMRIYTELLKSRRPMGVRELQRRVGLKSPSTVKYHLDRLIEAGLVEKLADGTYRAIKSQSTVLALYTSIRGMLMPRIIPIALGAIAFAITYILLNPNTDIILLGALIVFALLILKEGILLHRTIRKAME